MPGTRSGGDVRGQRHGEPGTGRMPNAPPVVGALTPSDPYAIVLVGATHCCRNDDQDSLRMDRRHPGSVLAVGRQFAGSHGFLGRPRTPLGAGFHGRVGGRARSTSPQAENRRELVTTSRTSANWCSNANESVRCRMRGLGGQVSEKRAGSAVSASASVRGRRTQMRRSPSVKVIFPRGPVRSGARSVPGHRISWLCRTAKRRKGGRNTSSTSSRRPMPMVSMDVSLGQPWSSSGRLSTASLVDRRRTPRQRRGHVHDGPSLPWECRGRRVAFGGPGDRWHEADRSTWVRGCRDMLTGHGDPDHA